MPQLGVMMTWKGVLVIFATVLIASSSCYFDCEDEEAFKEYNTENCSYYFDLLENALLNDSDNVYRLQQVFFPPNGNTPREVDISVTIWVGEIVSQGSCNEFCYRGNPWPSFSSGEYVTAMKWKKVRHNSILNTGSLMLFPAFESVFYLTFEYFFAFYDVDNYDPDNIYILLQLDQLPCNPCSDTTYDTLARIFTWAKAYARACGKPKTLDPSNRGAIDDDYTYDDYTYDDTYMDYTRDLGWNFINNLLLAGFVFLNVLVMLLMVRFVPDYYHKFVSRVNGDVNARHTSLSFYWGCALVFFFLAMALHILDLGTYCIYAGGIFYWHKTVGCISVKSVAVVVELVVCVFVCKRNTITVDIPFQRCTTNVLFCCCCCCCSRNLKSKVVQTLALWGIMVVVQHITASLIPLCFFIILQPAEVLSFLALIASTLFCIIMFVAHLLHLRHVAGHLQRTAFCIQMFAIISFIGLAIVSIVIYLQFLRAGVEFSGLGGFLGSLVPSIILSAVGWYVKTKFLDTKTPADPQPAALNLTTEPNRLETVVVNTPVWNSGSDGEQIPLLRHMN